MEEAESLGIPFNPNEPIFCHPDGKPIQSMKKGFSALLSHYDLLCDRQGRKRVLYSLRHTFATLAIEKGVNHWELARYMGTSVEELEKHYVHDHDSARGANFIRDMAMPSYFTLERFFEDD